MATSYSDFEALALTHEDLQFEPICDAFLRSDESVLHVDRHVWEPLDRDVPELDLGPVEALCRLGLTTLRQWDHLIGNMRGLAIRIAPPRLLIDDGWLDGQENAPPPHIYTCLAKRARAFTPVCWNEVERTTTGVQWLDAAGRGLRMGRVDGPDGEPGCWIFSVRSSG